MWLTVVCRLDVVPQAGSAQLCGLGEEALVPWPRMPATPSIQPHTLPPSTRTRHR